MTYNQSDASGISYTLASYGPNWLINTLPYLEEQALHDSFDLTRFINDTTPNNVNRTARGTQIPVLLCPSDAGYNRTSFALASRSPALGDNWARTNYAANAGRADIWGTAGGRYMNGPDSAGWKDNCKRGVMGPNTAVTLKRVTDGTSKTILIGEIRVGISPGDARGVWALRQRGR